jgi:alpha-beta hydrolase superfamily lysophospholipase
MRIKSEWVDTEIGIAFANEIHRFHLDALASRWATPLLIYHGMGDETVPVSDSIEFVERTPFADIELRLLKGGDHRLLPQKDELAEEFCRFFGRWRVCSKTH